MDTDPPPSQNWDLYRALREQWTHEDHVMNHRLMWLILSEGFLFTAYGALSISRYHWLLIGFPFFGLAVAAVIGISIFAAFQSIEEVHRQYEVAGLASLCALTPSRDIGRRAKWAAQALPFVFGALWLLALAGAFRIE